MKFILVVAVLVAVAYCEHCQHDASTCSDCTGTMVKACEQGICTCTTGCLMKADCSTLACPDKTEGDSVHHFEAQCMNGGCICELTGTTTGGVHHPVDHHPDNHHPDGGNHNPGHHTG